MGCVSERFLKECNEGKERIWYTTKGISVHSYPFKLAKFPTRSYIDDNKTELFSLLAQQAVTLPIEEGKELYSTCGDRVLTSATRSDLRFLEPCNHEEADTRLLVHVLDACSSGHRRILIKTNDADSLVLAVSVAENLPADEIWISYGTGKHLRHLAAHEIAKKIANNQCSVLIDVDAGEG